jgi:hypothetical protein
MSNDSQFNEAIEFLRMKAELERRSWYSRPPWDFILFCLMVFSFGFMIGYFTNIIFK